MVRLIDAIEGFWLARRRDMSYRTYQDYDLTYHRFVEFVGVDQAFEDITSADVHAFLNHWQKIRSAKTVCNMWIALSSLWSWAEREPSLRTPHIIRGSVPRPRHQRQQVEPFTRDEIKRLLAACTHTRAWSRNGGTSVRSKRATAVRDRAILLALLDTGMRSGELVALRMADYDRERGQIVIQRGKGGKRRVVYLGMRSRRALWRYLASRPDIGGDDPLFATQSGGVILRDNLYHMIRRIGERADVRNVHPHRFRHTFAISFLRNGGDPLTLQRILGHSNLSTVRLYVALAEVDVERAQQAASPADGWRL